MTDESPPDWITPGQQVLIYEDSFRRYNNPHAKLTRIVKVAKQSFTVEDCNERFRIADQRTKQLGSLGGGWAYQCVPADSEKAQQLLLEQQRIDLEYAAREACEQWLRNRTEENRAAAVTALTKLGELPTQDNRP
jgi:hypothetical protein